MTDLVIRGMEMPKYTTKAEFGIDADGNPLCMVYHEDGTEPDIYDVVPLPEGHGDLIDRDNVLLDIDCTGTNKFGMLDEDIRAFLRRYKPIVPAEGGTDDDGNA